MLGSNYSASRVLASSSEVPVAGSYQIQDPGSSRVVLSAGWGTPGLLLISSVIPLPIFFSQWGLPALSVLEARSPAGTWQWEPVGMLWKAP